MPALPLTSLLPLVDRNTIASNSSGVGSDNALQVVCAWPVSGQYGPGTRVLYYVLIAACVFARKAEWLRNACLAAALLFPAVAGIHGIVLAALHVNGAVDMDVYGAFQLCSIGILTAPVTVRLSRTYFYNPGRNAIFLWTGLIFAGLLSLTVEFYRLKSSPCPHDGDGTPVSPKLSEFGYNTTCGLVCDENKGPFSPMRGGSASNIYVIPAPDKLTFGTATLLAAACCIPAILSLVSMWIKILEINGKTLFGGGADDERMNEPIEGTNGATMKKMSGVNSLIRMFLSAVEIPVFGAAVLAILVIGERNLFSDQLMYQTEPIASVGQWAPIVASGLAVLGSMYLLLAADVEAIQEETESDASTHHCNCSVHGEGMGAFGASSASLAHQGTDTRVSMSNSDREASCEMVQTNSRTTQATGHQIRRTMTADKGSRRTVAKALTTVGNYFSTAAYDQFDDSEFRRGKAVDWPEIPGEKQRNIHLDQIKKQYNPDRDAEGNATPVLQRQRSRASSFTSSIYARPDIEGESSNSRSPSPRRPQSPRSPSGLPSATKGGRPHANTLPAERSSFEHQNENPSPQLKNFTRSNQKQRRDTLEVPSRAHLNLTRSYRPPSLIIDGQEPRGPPAIIISSDHDTILNQPTTSSPTELQSMPPRPASPPASVRGRQARP